MIFYTENSEKAINNLLELINDLSKGVGYKINIQKSIVFL